jgi:Holliday junction DNA helicase RuvA
MISRVKGTLLSRDPDGTVEVETAGGVVYEIDVSLTVLNRLPFPPAPVELRTVQIVREEKPVLCGFLEAVERELFKRLLSVHGVGAAIALRALSAYDAHRLARAIADKDVKALQQVSGIGKKVAQTIVIELSEKVADLAAYVPAGADAAPLAAQEAVAALVALGFSFTAADDAVRAVLENGGAATAEELIRKALAKR